MNRQSMSWDAVETAYGRNCVAALPSGESVEEHTSPSGEQIVVYRDPGNAAVRRLGARTGYTSIRIWLSPDGNEAYAWTAGNVAHFQLYGDLEHHGWHQVRFEPNNPHGPVVAAHPAAFAAVRDGRALRRIAGGSFSVHTPEGTYDIEAEPEMHSGFSPRP